jgi:hypothetical protein
VSVGDRLWAATLKREGAALDDFLEWVEEERQRLIMAGFHASSWEALCAARAHEKFLANLSNELTLADREEQSRARYRQRS